MAATIDRSVKNVTVYRKPTNSMIFFVCVFPKENLEQFYVINKYIYMVCNTNEKVWPLIP